MIATTLLLLTSLNATEPVEAMGKVILWKSASEVCIAKEMEPGCLPLVTSSGFGVKWIGRITEMEFAFDEDKPYDWPPTGNVKVVVTWWSSEPGARDYKCGHKYELNMNDLKEVEARSLIVKKC